MPDAATTTSPKIARKKTTKKAPAKAKKKATKLASSAPAVYGAMVDLTGIVSAPSKLKVFGNGTKKQSFMFTNGTIIKKTPGDKGAQTQHGDGRNFCISFVSFDKAQVKLWLQGVSAQQSLFRASVTKGK